MNISVGEISDRLASQVESVARMLLPGGKIVGRDWVAGSIHGEEGGSLKLCLSGDKVGVWADFASDDKGDLIDLWMASQGLDKAGAVKEAKKYLGIEDPTFHKPTKRKYRRPDPPMAAKKVENSDPVRAYLEGERKLSAASIAAYRVGALEELGPWPSWKSEKPMRGPWIVFPFFRGGDLLGVKYLHLKRKEGKKFTLVEPNCEPTCFGWHALDPNAKSLTICEGECFPPETEILTPRGWVAFGDYDGCEVAQWDNGEITFVRPIAKIEKQFNGDLLEYSTRGFHSITTPGHKMVSKNQSGEFYTHTANDGPARKDDWIPKVGEINGAGIPLSDDQIRLSIAVSADASVDQRQDGGRYVRFGFKKERKIVRLREITIACGIKISDNAIAHGYQSMCFRIPEWVPGRDLPWDWITKATERQRELIISELVLWDGNSVPNRNQHEFTSKIYSNALWVQTLAHTSGRCSTIIRRKNEYGSWYKVSILHSKQTTSWQTLAGNAKKIRHDGMVYCVTVPSGALLVRCNEKISVSGNCDAVTLHHYGHPAVSVPFGGGKGDKQQWVDYDWDYLETFDTIYLVLDTDDEGAAATAELIGRLGAHRCCVVTLPRKDANQCLQDGITKEEIDACFEAAVYLDPPSLKNAPSFLNEVIDAFYPKEKGLLTPWGHVTFRYLRGEVSVYTGWSGGGKSVLLGQVMAGLIHQGEKVCIASLEMRASKTLHRMVRQLLCDPEPKQAQIVEALDWLGDRLWLHDKVGSESIDTLLEVFEYAFRRYGVRQFVIDSLMRLGLAEDDYNGQKRVIDALTDFANRTNTHVHLVAHARKGRTENEEVEKMDIKGTGAITDAAFNVISIWRNRPKEKMLADYNQGLGLPKGVDIHQVDEMPDAIFSCVKSRNVDEGEGRFFLHYDRKSYQYTGPNVEPQAFNMVREELEPPPF